MENKKKHALVIGGAGFIGSHMVDALCGNGWHVTVLDNLSTGSLANLKDVLTPDVNFVNGSIEDTRLIQELATGKDAVFHFAAMVSVPLSIEKPEDCQRLNVTAPWNLLLALREHPVPFFYATSAAVYGNRSEGARREDEPPQPLSPYGMSKAINELQALTAWNVWRIPAVGFRFFNVYGPRQNPEGAYASVIPRFCSALANGKRPTVFGDGSQTRDFICVKDITHIMLKMLPKAEEAAGQVFNVATGISISVQALLELISEKMGVEPNEIRKPARAGDIRDSRADITKLKKFLGVIKFTDIDKGLNDTIAWYNEAAKHSNARG